MKNIIIQPYRVSDPKKYCGYPIEMRVVHSTHYRFIDGTRFDWGFASIAIEAGYTLIFLQAIKGDPDGR